VAQLKIDILQRLDFSKSLGDVSKFETINHKIISVPVLDNLFENTNC
jgi:hypothetical protein